MNCRRNSLYPSSLRLLLAVLLGVGVMMIVSSSGAHSQPEEPHLRNLYLPDSEKVAAPDFARLTLSGDTFRLSEAQGKIVVLNFWATWCTPCRDEVPDFVELQDELADDVQFVGVSLDEQGFEVVRPFAEEYEVNYPLVVDEDGMISRQYGGITAVPTTFVITRDGKVQYRTPGRVPKEILRSALLDMIEESG